jgi:hypothetical protein
MKRKKMDFGDIRSSLQRLGKNRIVMVATADTSGQPHLTAAGEIDVHENYGAAVTEWFCPMTIVNAEVGRKISVVAWDPETDTGVQLTGLVSEVNMLGMLDGYSPLTEDAEPEMQIQRRLCIDVEKVLKFSKAHHSDEEND